MAWTSIFPYVYAMMHSFGGSKPVNPTLVAGLLVSTFTFCEFISSLAWSRVSDIIGRKSALLIGAVGGLVPAITFGFSKSAGVAITSRVIGGLTNPNVGVIQTCVGEFVKTKAQQGRSELKAMADAVF